MGGGEKCEIFSMSELTPDRNLHVEAWVVPGFYFEENSGLECEKSLSVGKWCCKDCDIAFMFERLD